MEAVKKVGQRLGAEQQRHHGDQLEKDRQGGRYHDRRPTFRADPAVSSLKLTATVVAVVGEQDNGDGSEDARARPPGWIAVGGEHQRHHQGVQAVDRVGETDDDDDSEDAEFEDQKDVP